MPNKELTKKVSNLHEAIKNFSAIDYPSNNCQAKRIVDISDSLYLEAAKEHLKEAPSVDVFNRIIKAQIELFNIVFFTELPDIVNDKLDNLVKKYNIKLF